MSKRILERPAYTLGSYAGPAGTGQRLQLDLKTHQGYVGLDREEVKILAGAMLVFLGETMGIDPISLGLEEIPERTVLRMLRGWTALADEAEGGDSLDVVRLYEAGDNTWVLTVKNRNR